MVKLLVELLFLKDKPKFGPYSTILKNVEFDLQVLISRLYSLFHLLAGMLEIVN
jgi:hypothetical protein